jgi:hypothetical protein
MRNASGAEIVSRACLPTQSPSLGEDLNTAFGRDLPAAELQHRSTW